MRTTVSKWGIDALPDAITIARAPDANRAPSTATSSAPADALARLASATRKMGATALAADAAEDEDEEEDEEEADLASFFAALADLTAASRRHTSAALALVAATTNWCCSLSLPLPRCSAVGSWSIARLCSGRALPSRSPLHTVRNLRVGVYIWGGRQGAMRIAV
jgi:hypothetical protein